MNSTKAIAVMLGIMTLLLSNLYFPSYSLAQSRDPHRGLTVTRFLQFTPASINSGYPRVSLSFSILGTAREDSLLSYARDNHITYLEIYDLHKVFRYNDSAGTILPNGRSLIDGLCDFITKAKNNYCITEVGVAGEEQNIFGQADSLNQSPLWISPPINLSLPEIQFLGQGSSIYNLISNAYASTDSLFVISEKLKDLFRLFRFNGNCSSHFDFFNVADEYSWTSPDTNYYYNHFVPLMHYVDTLKRLYNSTHSDSVRIAVYIRAITTGNAQQNRRDSAAVYLVDGYDTLAPLADRILAVHYGATPQSQYTNNGWLSQLALFKRPLSKNKTDYHPYFSTETVFMNHYINYLGVWLRDKYQHNIFQAEDDFYRRWRSDANTNVNSVHENNIRPGGFHYFASDFMIDSLKQPRIDTTNSPICTAGLLGDTARIYYMGPREDSIYYTLAINNNGSIITTTGYTGAEDSLLNNISFPGFFLDTLHSPYPINITLTYSTGCSYSFNDTIVVKSRAFIQATGPTTFCQGSRVTLRSTRGSSYNWRVVGSNLSLGNSRELVVDSTGTYYCIVNGGGCPGTSNQISVTVQSNPVLSIFANCLDSTHVALSVIPAPPAGSTYFWSTNDTTPVITISTPGAYEYYVHVTSPSGCVQTGYKGIQTPTHIPHPNITFNQGKNTYCKNDPSVISIQLSPTDYHYGANYHWNVNGAIYDTYGNLSIPTLDSNATIYLTESSGTGCSNLGYDSVKISVFNCCPNPDSTSFFSDSTSNFPTGFIGRSINIRGDLIINTNFTISGSTLSMDSSSRIFILPGKTLTIQNSRLSSCSNMWNGISFADNTSLLIMNGDTIEDAYQAISDSAGAKITVSNTIFNKNRRAILIVGSATALTSTVANCTFTCQDNSGIVSQTKDGGSAYSGIEMSGMNGWTLNSNHFNHLYYGIKSENSSLVLNTCTFNDMRRYSYTYSNLRAASWTWVNDGYGIYSLNTLASPISLLVQGSNFSNCGFGVSVINSITTEVTGSTFDSLRYSAVSVSNPSGVDVNIHDNTISHFLVGVSVSEPRVASSTTIKQNTFTTSSNLNTSPLHNAAVNWSVKLQNRLPGVTTASVSNNQMTDQLKGIYLNGCNQVEVNSNNIELIGSANTTKQYGIWLVNSSNCIVSNDSVIITTAGISDPTHARGIRFESSTGCLINNNFLLNLGSGLNGLNYCDSTTLCGNDIRNCVRGFDIYNLSLPDQGSLTSPEDNMWRNIPLANRTVGVPANSTRIKFYHRYTQNDVNNKFSPGTNINTVRSFPNITGLSPCSVPDTFPQMFTDLTDQVIKDSIVFSIYDQENKWYAEKYAFHLLSKDSMLMNQGLPTDIQRQQFFDNLKQRNIGGLEDIQKALEEEDYLQAISKLINFQPENSIEQNLKDVFGLMEKVQSSTPLSSDDSLVLDIISEKLAFEGGPGVFIARAIMDEEYDDELTGSLLRQSNNQTGTFQPEILLYPNPTSGKIVISKDFSKYSGCEFIVLDLKGRSFMKSEINIGETLFEKDLSFLSTGAYMLEIYCDDSLIESLKLIIQK